MDTQKALQIMKSRDKIEVLYNETPVWIQGLNGDTAKVKFLNTGSMQDVPVSDLILGSNAKKR